MEDLSHDPTVRSSHRWLWFLVGVISALAGSAAAHLVAAWTNPAASPVIAVGATVIDNTPTPIKEWAVREMGTADKPVLLGTVAAVTLIMAGLIGLLTSRSRLLGVLALVVLVGVAGAAALARPAAGLDSLLPTVAAAAVGAAVLLGLTHLMRTSVDPESPVPADFTTSRRVLLLTGGGVLVATASVGWWAQRLSRVGELVASVRLPKAAKPLPALPVGLEDTVPGISSFVTPNSEFYRVDINLSVPIVAPQDWTLEVGGDVDEPFTLTFDELLAMPLVERDVTMTCVSNEVGGRYVGAARWLGVPVRTLLERAGVREGADQVLSTAEDGFTISTPLGALLDDRDALLAVGMNGKPLPGDHGFPVRLITPGLYGYVGATKWLRKLTVTTYAEKKSYWTERGWAEDGPIKVSSRIDTPAPLARIKAGMVPIAGVAWAQQRGIERVELSIDGGAWRPTELGPEAGIDYWRQWYFAWDAKPGRHTLSARAVSLDGEMQTAARAMPFPNGASGIQEIQMIVE